VRLTPLSRPRQSGWAAMRRTPTTTMSAPIHTLVMLSSPVRGPRDVPLPRRGERPEPGRARKAEMARSSPGPWHAAKPIGPGITNEPLDLRAGFGRVAL
jgi:hypothetical protein